MDWTMTYDEAGNYIRVTCTGFFSEERHAECFRSVFSSPYWKPGVNLLFDNRNLQFGNVKADTLIRISNYYKEAGPMLGKRKIALLMSSIPEYGIGRQFQMLAEGKGESEIRIFNFERAAVEWLTGRSILASDEA